MSARRRRRPAAAATPAPSAPATRPGLRLDGATAFSFGLVVLFAWVLWQSRGFDVRAGLFPWVIAACSLGLAVIQLTSDLTGRPGVTRADAVEAGAEGPSPTEARRTAAISGWIVGMFVAIWLIGFSLATLITTFFYLKLGARERWALSVALSLAGFAFVYVLFEKGLAVPFPAGRLFDWLGYGS